MYELLDPIPTLTGNKAIEFEKRIRNVKPLKLTEEEISWLKSMKINGKEVLRSK
jgi:hypothetical protein